MLLTEFVTVGTEGATVDGRTIEKNHLIEMSEAYDPDIYTAVINGEHEKWYGNLGVVHATRLGKNKQGKTTLEAQLRPNYRLIQFNMAGQKLFTSMEIKIKFSDTGKAYLTGLAVTDEPASLSTSMLQLFSKSNDNGNTSYSDPTEFSLGIDEGENIENILKGEEPQKIFTKFLASIGITNNQSLKNATDNQEETDMTEEQFNELKKLNTNQAESVQKLTNAVTSLTTTVAELSKNDDGEAIDDTQESEVTLSEVTKQLELSNKKITELESEVNKFKEEMPPKFKGGNEGDAGKEKEFI